MPFSSGETGLPGQRGDALWVATGGQWPPRLGLHSAQAAESAAHSWTRIQEGV